MKVLILGSGGREHAIGWKLAQSPSLELLVSAPGNPGLAEIGEVASSVDVLDEDAVVSLAVSRRVDLVVVGPEAPLAAGIVDVLADNGIAAFGPSAAGARLEASKAYAKEVMAAAGVPTARAETFVDATDANLYLDGLAPPFVVKADGLAAGKGVLVTSDLGEARAWVRLCIDGHFGDAGATVVIEDYLEGPELSVIALCDGERALALPPARDYKRLKSGDRGPNTGGMGCYSPVDVPLRLVDEVTDDIMLPVLRHLTAKGVAYRGFLYAGLVLTEDGPRVLEFNCRLGDPEAQVLLPRLDEDLLELMVASFTGTLPERPLRVRADAAVNVVLAAPGYPEAVQTGASITGLDTAHDLDGVEVFHAGTTDTPEGLAVSGGRVLNVVGIDPDRDKARHKAYAAAAVVAFDGKQLRTDIAR